MPEQVWLKGESFQNRYRLKGTLTTKTPLHVGNGEEVTRPGLRNDKTGELVKVSSITTDYQDHPYIPGSTIKGVLRSYLLEVLQSVGPHLAAFRDFERMMRSDQTLLKQEQQINFVKTRASVLERLFGTPFAEGKIEIWDAPCRIRQVTAHPSISSPDKPPYWQPTRMTYVDQSVAIDPETHTALDKKLYHYEVVPPGVCFELNISGQNLALAELGMLLFCLHAFNSEIWPPTLGAMASRGLGHVEFKLESIHLLSRDMVPQWLKTAVQSDHAGYQGIPALDGEKTKQCVEEFKRSFLHAVQGGTQ